MGEQHFRMHSAGFFTSAIFVGPLWKVGRVRVFRFSFEVSLLSAGLINRNTEILNKLIRYLYPVFPTIHVLVIMRTSGQ